MRLSWEWREGDCYSIEALHCIASERGRGTRKGDWEGVAPEVGEKQDSVSQVLSGPNISWNKTD